MSNTLQKKPWYKRPAVLVIGFILLIFMLRGMLDSKTEPAPATNNLAATAPAAEAAPVTEAPAPAPPADPWVYHESEDEMTSKKKKYASIDANELLHFDFPYAGGSTATLTLRKGGPNDAFIRVSKGQFNSTVNGAKVRVRFDNNAPQTFSMSEAADYSSDILFFDNPQRLIAGLKKAKTAKIQATFFNEGDHIMEFDVAGLKW